MLGPGGPGGFERMVAAVRRAAASDSLDALRRVPQVDRILLAGPKSELTALTIPEAVSPIFELDAPNAPFHFGERLSAIVDKHGLSRVLYLGAGSMPLMPQAELSAVIRQISEASDRVAITNNVHSADWAAFNHAESFHEIARWIERDNMLAWRLRESAGYAVSSLAPSAATRLDIDTPFDLQALALYSHTSDNTREVLERLRPDLNLARLQSALKVLSTPGSRVTLIGRVSGVAAELLASKAHCWTRVFSEERGMVASRRWADRQVFSLVADHIDRVGLEEFTAQLARVSDLVLWDTRVYLAHHNRWPPAQERFASDLGHPNQIADGRLRRLTEAALRAQVPIMLGGHNVVSGGLYMLLQIMAEQS